MNLGTFGEVRLEWFYKLIQWRLEGFGILSLGLIVGDCLGILGLGESGMKVVLEEWALSDFIL